MIAEIHTMGTVVTLTIEETGMSATLWSELVGEARAELERLDAGFSTYREDSEVTRYRNGQLLAPSSEFDEVYALCETARELTAGFFDPWVVPGGYDPSGLVKGWAVERILGMLIDAGCTNAVVNGGGDIAICADSPINVGIQHPRFPDRLCAVVQAETAVATSGLYERGAHIVNPLGQGFGAIAATIVGAPLYFADAIATAVVAGGDEVLEFVATSRQFSGFLVTEETQMHVIAGTPLASLDAVEA